MSNNCIKLGKWYSSYKYLFLAIIFALLKDVAFGSTNYASFLYLKLLDAGNISNCFLIRKSFCYLFSTIIAFIFYKIHNNNSGENDPSLLSSQNLEINESIRRPTSELELIHIEQEIRIYPNKKLLLIIFLWVFEEEFISYFNNIMLHLDFWMMELIIVHFFMKKMLKNEVYSHQKLMLWFCIVPFILKLTTIILSFCDEGNFPNNNEYKYPNGIEKLKIIYVAIPWLWTLGLIIYSILIFLRSYINTKIKWLIDLKYISSIKIFILFNIIGFIFCTLISILVSFLPCDKFDEGDDFYTFKDYFCTVHYENQKYLDNFIIYFKGLYSNSDNYLEIISLILGVIFFCFYKFFCLKVIEFLSPVYLIFSFPIYYVFNKIYLLFLNYFKSGEWILKMRFSWPKLILDFSSDFFAIIGYLIYLEIIELHFCKFDYNIRRNINDRGDAEADKTDLDKSNKSSSFSTSEDPNSEIERENSLD